MRTFMMKSMHVVVLVLFLCSLPFLTGCGSDTEGQAPADGDSDIDGELEQETELVWKEAFDYCELDTPPDANCYASKRDPQSAQVALAIEIAQKQMALHTAESVAWSWGETVMMLGLVELYRITGDTDYRDYYKAWIDHHIEEGYLIGTSDTCAPAAVALAVLQDFDEAKYRTVLDDAFYYLDEVAHRTDEGGLNHLGTFDALGVTLWVDSLFMFGNVMTKWGEYSGEVESLDDYVEQFEIFSDVLQKEGGFYKHAYQTSFEQEDNVFWARGNAWVTAATYDHLRVRRNRGENIETLRTAIEKQVDAFLAVQDEQTGLWWTILNRPDETYLETSASALVAFALARAYRYGLQDETVLPVIEKAMEGIKARITRDAMDRPVVTGTSGPTNPGTFEVYAAINQVDDISYGLGSVMLALLETSGLPFDE